MYFAQSTHKELEEKVVILKKKQNKLQHKKVGFEVFTAVSMKMAVFWVVAPCSLVEVYRRFRGPCCLHHQGDIALHGPTTQKTAIFVQYAKD
jgi:hypothetical protein